MKKRLLTVALLLVALQATSQTAQLGQPLSWNGKVPVSKKTIEMPLLDNQELQQAEMERRATSFEKNLRFGHEETVNINFIQEADVTQLPNGYVMRQLIIHSEGALSLNLIFSQFELVQGARLYLYDKAHKEYIGAHTSLNNNQNRMLGTELIHSDNIVIELVEPAATAGQSVLTIGTVIHGYLDLEQELKALNDSGDCNYDVNCPIGAGWENQRNATALMVDGGGFCTGSLVNNTSGNIIPYFLSANHCGTTPGGWVFRFRWESPAAQADCATNANSVNGPTNMNINGGVLRASYANSDVTLTELNTAPDPAWGIYYNGWNRTDVPATSAVGIHHPSGDIKKISFEYEPLISTTFGGAPANSHWGVTQWDEGVTEPGSSGSPLFDQNHRTIGQLHGGASACGNGPNALSDEYGKFFTSWTGGGSNSNRLSNWLDPGNTGAEFIDGVDPSGPGNTLDAGVGSLQGVNGTYCTGTVSPQVTITNSGSDALTSATINYGFDGNINLVYNWTGNLAQYQSEVVTLPNATLAGGNHTFEANVTNPNGNTDQNNGNNTVSSSFTTVVNGETADFTLTLDCYGSEITWEVQDINNASNVFYSGGPYADANAPGGEVINETFCLAAGCYKFVIEDSWGDGLTSNNCTSGSYTIIDENNVTVAELTQAQANFGSSNTKTFCLGTNTIGELNDLQQQWVVYPNPADQIMYIEMSAIDGMKEVTLLSPSGQVVSRVNTAAGQASISAGDLAKGVYFVRLASDKGTTTKTIVIK